MRRLSYNIMNVELLLWNAFREGNKELKIGYACINPPGDYYSFIRSVEAHLVRFSEYYTVEKESEEVFIVTMFGFSVKLVFNLLQNENSIRSDAPILDKDPKTN